MPYTIPPKTDDPNICLTPLLLVLSHCILSFSTSYVEHIYPSPSAQASLADKESGGETAAKTANGAATAGGGAGGAGPAFRTVAETQRLAECVYEASVLGPILFNS